MVGEHEQPAAALDDPCEFHPVGDRRGQRLVADHVQPGFETGLGRGEVEMVGRDHRDDFHAVGPRRLARDHLLHCGVGAFRCDADLRRRSPGPLRRRREDPGDNLEFTVQPGGDAMHAADEGTLATADHAELDRFARVHDASHFRQHLDPREEPAASYPAILRKNALAENRFSL